MILYPGQTSRDLALWEIYRRNARKRGVEAQLAEDIASEMYATALHNERVNGCSRFDNTWTWLFFSAWRKCTYREKDKNRVKYVPLQFGYHPFYGNKRNGEYVQFSTEKYEQYLCSIWADTSNRDGSRFLKKYTVTCDGVEITLSGSELRELLGQDHNITDAQYAGNLKKRGKRVFLINDDLWRTLQDAAEFYNLSVRTLYARFEVREIKVFVK